MAYHCLHTNSFSGYTEALEFISTSLQTIGWILHDDISSTDKVFTSTGEDDDFVNAYIRIHVSTYVHFEGYMWWNNNTQVGTGKSYTDLMSSSIRPYSNNSLIVYGDKDEIVVWAAGQSYQYTTKSFGFVQPYIKGYATTTSGISSGSNIIVNVDSTSFFKTTSTYLMIIGNETEGRDRVYLNSIDSDTQITLSSTPRSYTSGAKLGHFPCTFYCNSYYNNITDSNFYYICGYKSSSTLDSTNDHTYNVDGQFHTRSYIDPDSYLNKYVLQPFGLREYNSPYSSVGYLKHLKYAPVSNPYPSYYNQYIYCNGKAYFLGTPTSSTSSGIIDIGHSWTNDEFKDKIVIITSGPGTGQTRKVLSNNNDTISIGNLWGAIPDNTSTYEIYDSVYRNIFGYYCIKEIVS